MPPSRTHAERIHAQEWLAELAARLVAGQPQVLVTVGQTRGSTPRNAGARMWVGPDFIVNTIGGGHLEWKAIAHAREILARGDSVRHAQRYPLGPGLGQCCGGVVWIIFEYLDSHDAPWCVQIAQKLASGVSATRSIGLSSVPGAALGRNVNEGNGVIVHALSSTTSLPATELNLEEGSFVDVWSAATTHIVVCGAGHIGQAVVALLADLPVRVTWLDPRDAYWPSHRPVNVQIVQGGDEAVPDMPEHAYWLVLTHSHALDLAIIDSVFRYKAFTFMGLIGSNTKRARFMSRLRQRHDITIVKRLCCPVGLVQTSSKQPAVIAVSIVAQLLGLIDA